MITIQPINSRQVYNKTQNNNVQQQINTYKQINSIDSMPYYKPFNIAFGAKRPEIVKNLEELLNTCTQTNFVKEIEEQPKVLQGLCNKCLNSPDGINLDLGLTDDEAKKMTGVRIVASGSSKNAANCAKHFIENVAKLPVDVQYSGEFAHKDVVANKNDLMIFISQSGETADTYSALKKAQAEDLKTVALTNVESSKIHKEADGAINVSAGEEKAVAATKSVTAQLMNLYIMGLKLAEQRGTLSKEEIKEYSDELKTIPKGVEEILNNTEDIKSVAKELKDENNIFILARGASEGAASEGALKLRETMYVNPVPYNSGEFMHGPIASVDESTPVIQIVAGKKGSENYELSKTNVQEIIDKRNPKKAFVIKSDKSDDVRGAKLLAIPEISEDLSALYSIVKFQLLAKELTSLTGKNPDSPRSLTKAVIHE